MKIRNFWFFALLIGCNSSEPLDYRSELASQSSAATCDQSCLDSCKNIFFLPDDVDECTQLTPSEVNIVSRTLQAMKAGSWKSVSEEGLAALTRISYEPWLKYTRFNLESSEEMLVWLSEEQWAASYASTDVLEGGIKTLSYLPGDRGVKDGFFKHIDSGKTFLEFLALQDNEGLFRTAHSLIEKVCRNQSLCINEIYCRQTLDVVIDKAKKLNLSNEPSC